MSYDSVSSLQPWDQTRPGMAEREERSGGNKSEGGIDQPTHVEVQHFGSDRIAA